MYTTWKTSLLTVCIGILFVIGACSGSSSPVTANPAPDLSKYASTVEGIIYSNNTPSNSGQVFVYNLDTLNLAYKAEIGSDGKYIAGVDAGQFLVFPVTPSGWRIPDIETDFSNYVNVEAERQYRMDIKLNGVISPGEKLVFGFVTSKANNQCISGAVVSCGGKSTRTDGYGFYAMTVPSDASEFVIKAEGFFDQREKRRNSQAAGSYFETPFFKLNPKDTSGASIGGAVRDVADGTGLGGVRVTLLRPEDPNWEPIVFLTNLGGQYRFFNITQGIYKLYFERPGYQSGYREGLVVKADDKAIINVFLHRETSGRASIWGYVNNSAMPLPIGGARVTASNPLLGSYFTTTKSTGFYEILQVIPANYTITVVAPSSGGTTFYESVSTFQTIAVGANRVDFNLRFINEGVLRGNVTVSGATDEDPLPTGVEVTAEKIGGPFTGVKFRTTTDGKGEFVFNGIPIGIYLVKARIAYAPSHIYYAEQQDVVVNAGTSTNIDLVLEKQ